MAKSKQQKELTVKSLTDKLGRAKAVVFANFEGLTVSQVTKLRNECRVSNVDYLVAKKTLLKKALELVGLKDIEPKAMAGGITTVLAYDDEVVAAKVLSKFAKDNPALKIAGGILENKFVAVATVNSLASIPSREELLAKAVGSIAAPLSGLVKVLHGNLRNLVFVLQAIREKK